MAVLDFPADILPSSCMWKLIPRTKLFTNPFNGSRQTMNMPGTHWEAKITFNNLNRDKANRLFALIHQLQGASGRVAIWDHAFAQPQGKAQGTPLVDGGGQTGNRLSIKGCKPNSNFLKIGDYAQIGNQLVILTQDADINNEGKCQLNFEAPMRKSPQSNTVIVTNTPKAIMMLKDDKQGGRRSSKRLVLSSLSLSLIEDVNT